MHTLYSTIVAVGSEQQVDGLHKLRSADECTMLAGFAFVFVRKRGAAKHDYRSVHRACEIRPAAAAVRSCFLFELQCELYVFFCSYVIISFTAAIDRKTPTTTTN